jgi:hypothetical protein
MHRSLPTLLLGWLAASLALGGVGAAAVQAQAGLDDADRAWAAVRARYPAETPIYRPTWLPPRFQGKVRSPAPGPFYGVTYGGDQGDFVAFTFGPVNSAPDAGATPVATPVAVRGIPGQLIVQDGAPPIQIRWEDRGLLYGIRGEHGQGRSTLTREEILRIAASLAPVGADGKAIPGLPDTGAGWTIRPAPATALVVASAFLALLGIAALLIRLPFNAYE